MEQEVEKMEEVLLTLTRSAYMAWWWRKQWYREKKIVTIDKKPKRGIHFLPADICDFNN